MLDHQIHPPIRRNRKLGSPTAYLRARRARSGNAERASASERSRPVGPPARPGPTGKASSEACAYLATDHSQGRIHISYINVAYKHRQWPKEAIRPGHWSREGCRVYEVTEMSRSPGAGLVTWHGYLASLPGLVTISCDNVGVSPMYRTSTGALQGSGRGLQSSQRSGGIYPPLLRYFMPQAVGRAGPWRSPFTCLAKG